MKIGVILFIIISIGLLVYSNSLGNDFVWDDTGFVIQNDFIKDLRFIPFYFISKTALAKGGLAGENYRPFLTLSYGLDYFFWKLNPLGYHISNLIFHIASAILVFYLVLSLTKNRFTGLFSSLFFLTHPIQTESVSWISGRADVLFLFFYLGAFITYIKYTERRQIFLYLASLLLFSSALLSKEMAASFPLMIILYDFFYGKKEKISIRAIRYFAYFLILEGYVIIRFNIIGRLAQCDYWTGNMYTTFLTMAKGIVHYIGLLIYPGDLCVDYLTFPISLSIKEPEVLLSIAVILFLIAGAMALAKKHKHVSFCTLWFFITLSPAANIIPIKILIAERFLYLPSIGYSVVIAVFLMSLYGKFRERRALGYSFICLGVLLVSIYSRLTMTRNADWSSDLTLWKKAVLKYPDNVRARHNLAVAYLAREGDPDKAYEEVKVALRIHPEYSLARTMVVAYYAQNNRFDEAIEEAKYILRADPDFIDGYRFLGAIYAIQNKYDLAYMAYRKALARNPDFLEAKFAIASLHSLKGDIDLAIEKYKEILKEPPPEHYRSHYAAAYLALGELYAGSGDGGNALKAWRKVYEDFGEQVWFNEISKFLVGKTQAKELLLETKRWQPEFKVICYYYIGVKKEMDKDFEGAKMYYRKSMDVATPTLAQIKVLATKRLEKLEKNPALDYK